MARVESRESDISFQILLEYRANYKARPNNMANKKATAMGGLIRMIIVAERGGFEPPLPCGKPDFESGTFNHSATSPER